MDQREDLLKARSDAFAGLVKKEITDTHTVHSIGVEELIGRAIKNARSRRYNKGAKHPRWVAVKDLLQLGTGFSMEICRYYGLDPDEEVSR